ncbi:hypothetical protein BD410DRAFT_784531, partial [Rickenella mellea]
QQFAQQQHLQAQRPQVGQQIAGVKNPEYQQQHQSRGGGEGVVQQRMDQMADFLRSQDFSQQVHGMPAPGQIPQGLPSGPTQQQMLQAMMNQRQNQSLHPSQMPAGPSGLQQQQLQQMAQAGRMNFSNPTAPPMMDSKRFFNNLKVWLQRSGTPVDARLLTVDNRSIDLHQLHREVMLLGGGQAVSHRDLWPDVAAKLGWTSFPSNGNEPVRSAPQAAAHVNNVYNMYLSGFEAYYVQAFMQNRNREDHQNVAPPAGPPRSPSTPQAPNGINPSFPSQQRLLQYAELSADEIRNRGESEHVVQQVEANRGVLQRQVLQQQALRSMNAQGTQFSAPNAMQQLMQSNGSQSFGTPQPPQIAPQGPPQTLMNQITGQQGGHEGLHNPNGAVGMPRPVSQLGGVQVQGLSNNLGQRQVYSRPSPEQFFASERYIQAMKAEFNANRTLQQLQPKHLPDHERNEFNKMLEMLWRGTEQIDQWMPLYHAVFQDQIRTQRLIQIIITTNHQRQLLSSGQPNYVLDLATVKRLFGMVQAAWEKFVSAVRTFPEAQGNNMPGGTPGAGPLEPTGPPLSQHWTTACADCPVTPHHRFDTPPVGQPTTQEVISQQTPPSEVNIVHDLPSRLSALTL